MSSYDDTIIIIIFLSFMLLEVDKIDFRMAWGRNIYVPSKPLLVADFLFP